MSIGKFYTEKFYEEFTGPCGLNDVRFVELDKATSAFYFDSDYPQPMAAVYLEPSTIGGYGVFRFVVVTGELEYNSAGRVESIEFAFCNSFGSFEFDRFYFNNPFGARIYLLDRRC